MPEERNRQKREIQEAIAAGKEARRHLEATERLLNSAANWGIWDIIGGGFLVTGAKHWRLRDAKEASAKAEKACRSFARELRDVVPFMDVNLEIEPFLKFADFFFDGFIADVMVQSRINRMLSDVRRQLAYVNRTLDTLTAKLRRSEWALP